MKLRRFASWLTGTLWTPPLRWGAVWRLLSRFHREERGVAYATSIAITLPLFAIILAVVIQLSLILTVYLGCQYGAYAGARSAAVWNAADVAPATAKLQVRRAVLNAMTPFVSGNVRGAAAPGGRHADDDCAQFAETYARFAAERSSAASYIAAKRRHAESCITITQSYFGAADDEHAPATATVTVQYDYPLAVAFAGRLLGQRKGGHSSYSLNASAELPLEASLMSHATRSASRNRSLGIRYYELH